MTQKTTDKPAPDVAPAAADLLKRLDCITTLQYAQGAMTPEMARLRTALRATGVDVDAMPTPDPAPIYPATPGSIGDLARILDRAAALDEATRARLAHQLEAAIMAAETGQTTPAGEIPSAQDLQLLDFYLGPRELGLGATWPPADFDRVMAYLVTRYGKRRLGDMGTAFLVSWIRDVLQQAKVGV
jgi:hypothetical protein